MWTFCKFFNFFIHIFWQKCLPPKVDWAPTPMVKSMIFCCRSCQTSTRRCFSSSTLTGSCIIHKLNNAVTNYNFIFNIDIVALRKSTIWDKIYYSQLLTIFHGKTVALDDGKWNHLSMTYSLTNECAKNYCNRILIVQVIVENVVTCCFSETQCISEC